MNSGTTGIVDIVVDHNSLRTSFEEWITPNVAGEYVSDNRNVRGVVMDQRTFGVLSFYVSGVTQSLRDQVIAKCDIM